MLLANAARYKIKSVHDQLHVMLSQMHTGTDAHLEDNAIIRASNGNYPLVSVHVLRVHRYDVP